jgi:hypothetical protein
MFRSIVLFTWADGVTDDQKKAAADELSKLPDQIPVLRRIAVGEDAGLRADNADFGVVADFDSPDDYPAYLEHPAHAAVVGEYVRPIVAGRTAIQFEF